MHQTGYLKQPLRLEPERVRARQEDALAARPPRFEEPLLGLAQRVVVPSLRFQQIGLDMLDWGWPELERQIGVKRAELAGMVGASRRGLDDERIGLVGRPPDSSRVVHDLLPFPSAVRRQSRCMLLSWEKSYEP